MIKIRSIMRVGCMGAAAILLVFNSSLLTFADDSSDSSTTTCTAPKITTPGVHVPTGSDASTFTYQCTGQYAGDWTNEYYAYDPLTNTRTAIYQPNYGYDCATGIWTMDSWDYDAVTDSYVDDRVQTTAPAGVITDCSVANTSSSSNDPTSSTNSPDTTGTDNQGAGSNVSAGTSNGGSNSSTTNNNGTTYVNNGTTVADTNDIDAGASSGNSLVLANTTAGNASTGDVQDEDNIINMLQSSSNALGSGSNVVTFTDNVNGDVDGNLLLDPSMLTVQPASSTSNNTTNANNVTINNSNGLTINNTINLAADSGNADVSQNTTGGNATSGSAQAIANVVNLMNSIITAGKSFIGVININGNLDGNILVPSNFVNELVADNIPTVTISAPNSSSNSSTNNTANTTITNTNNEGISNNVQSSAASGQATVEKNTSAGNATTGSAATNLTAFNLTGSQVIGANDLLVFVNVLGTWVGMIMNAPAGTTAAELGGGISSDTTNTANTDVNNNTNEEINNNINVSAQSGNANVSQNTNGGSATSGNAATAVNLANVENSTLSLSDWFGVLFINVFGTWDGSFEVDPGTSAQTSSVESVTPAVANEILSHQSTYGYSTTPTVTGSDTTGSPTASTTTPSTTEPATEILAAKNVKSLAAAPNLASTSRNAAWKTYTLIAGLVALYIVLDAVVSQRKKHLKGLK